MGEGGSERRPLSTAPKFSNDLFSSPFRKLWRHSNNTTENLIMQETGSLTSKINLEFSAEKNIIR